jgi:adenosine deaminase
MQEPIQIEVTEEQIKLAINVQRVIKEKVSQKGIIVEVNPTSNAEIGDVENIFNHYIHNLNQHELEKGETINNKIKVTINSDDPSVFNTNVNNEFAYIFYALEEKGYERENILMWLDKIRKNGLRSSFIETRDLNYQQRKQEIENILEKLNNY